MIRRALLRLERFGVKFGSKIILTNVSLSIPERGMTVLVGPTGTGKSTLLRTLHGQFDNLSSATFSGSAEFAGEQLFDAPERPALVSQGAKLVVSSVLDGVLSELPERGQLSQRDSQALVELLLERSKLEQLIAMLHSLVSDLDRQLQRRLSILRSAASNPRMLLVDEPTAELEESEAQPILDQLLDESSRRSVLVVTHNQKHAQYLGGQTLLLAGGTIRAAERTEAFFKKPPTETSRLFVRTGSCATPNPNSKQEDLDPEYVEKQAKRDDRNRISSRNDIESVSSTPSEWLGPRGFHWVRAGELGGTPKPGLLRNAELDLKALKRVGITTLLTVMEQPLADDVPLDEFGIKAFHFPVQDMCAPSFQTGLEICNRINELISAGDVVAVHCKAGLGRTGTMLAAWLIQQGETSLKAIKHCRSIEPRWIQSEEQLAFLNAFGSQLKQAEVPELNTYSGSTRAILDDNLGD
ncbi:MAG: ATP-binding cassette domain-containing protein [Planctomycetes bacterium]|nr:ATP-binding cassette domain-containing protein [Planctomycetota bacterium]